MIDVRKVSYNIGKLAILSDVSLDVQAGEMVVILGGNGAGKSTLLKAICGDISAATGSIAIQSKDIENWKQKELATVRAVLQQQTLLSMPFTVKDVVMMGRYPHFNGSERDADHVIVREALKKTGIEHLQERNYLHLSGGEQQRVQLARVFAQVWNGEDSSTRCLFMDEPVNSLDIRHQHTTLEMAKEFAKEGNCVLAVLHDLNLAIQYADRILLMKKGRVVAFGTPKEVMKEDVVSAAYDHPLKIFNSPHYQHPVVVPVISN
jgi:iron complex transport system ATP-binding protein